jgi:hypothetical protein
MVFTQIDLLRRIEGWAISTPLMRSVCFSLRQEQKDRSESYRAWKDISVERAQEYGVGRIVFSMVDEESKININMASENILAVLPGIDLVMANHIATSPLRPFSVKEELLLIDGFSREMFDACKDFITTYSNGKININTAPTQVLIAAGINEAIAERLDAFRKGNDGKPGTLDDGYFTQTGDIDQKLKELLWVSEPERIHLVDLVNGGVLGVDSESFTIAATTFVLGKKANMYTVIIGKNRILRWQEH